MQYFVVSPHLFFLQLSSADLKAMFLLEPCNTCCIPGFTSGNLQRGRLRITNVLMTSFRVEDNDLHMFTVNWKYF